MHTTHPHRIERRFPIGAELVADDTIHFRVWAPKPRHVELVLATDPSKLFAAQHYPMESEGDGYFSLTCREAKVGMLYGYRLDDRQRILSDPASRFQPEGPAGLSQIVDARSFVWSDQEWSGLEPLGQVIYEMHVGTFTSEGTFANAMKELPELARIGITVIEMMPVADFPGRFGWGYDGVSMFAPTRLYGQPDDFRRFVNRAHGLGVGVILDVVYNHFGGVDNNLVEFADNFKSQTYKNEWGDAINFDGKNSQAVREFFEANARYWIEEFHLDGFRFDATQQIFDRSREHILVAINHAVKKAANDRRLYLIAENAPQDVRLVKPIEHGGNGLDALVNDDFHHAAHVRLTGDNPAYYADFLGTVEELAAAVKHGFIYQGQLSVRQEQPRGTPTMGLPATSFVSFLENHDQIANSATGERINRLTSPGRYRAMTTLWLLMPQTPMFFQGQEFGASNPFLYFADFSGEVGTAVAEGRAKFLSQFPALATKEAQLRLPNPADPESFHSCKLDFEERETHQEIYDLHVDLLNLRREDPIFRLQRADSLDTARLSDDCLAIRYFSADDNDRLLVVNFGEDLALSPVAEPLLAPLLNRQWNLLWNSNLPRYGGSGIPSLEINSRWFIPAETAVVLCATAVIPAAQ